MESAAQRVLYPTVQRARLSALYRSRDADDPVRVEAQHEFDLQVTLHHLTKDLSSRKFSDEDRELLISVIRSASS